MATPCVKIEVMESQFVIGGKKYLALAIDDKRHGPDAGPWKVIESLYVRVDDLQAAIDKVKANGG